MLNNLRPQLNTLINFFAKPFSFINPNILSFGTLLLALPGFYFFSIGNSLLGSLFILGAVFDSIDGAVARMKNKISKFGSILDATVDRAFEGFLFLSIGMGGLVSWELLFLSFNFAVLVPFIKAKGEASLNLQNVGTNKLSVGLIQRGERIAILFIGSLLNGIFTNNNNEILQLCVLITMLASIVTLLWRGVVIYKLTNFANESK